MGQGLEVEGQKISFLFFELRILIQVPINQHQSFTGRS